MLKIRLYIPYLMQMSRTFDYIILGGGASGLSLAMRLVQQPALQTKSIAIVERDAKESNDRTWCFWATSAGIWENVATSRWQHMQFLSPDHTMTLDLDPYQYHMIRSKDLYAYARKVLNSNPNITWIQAEVQRVADRTVHTSAGVLEAQDYIFSSIYQPPTFKPNDHNLLQHFKGWFIKVPEEIHQRLQPVLMDFTIPQQTGCDFIYTLPIPGSQVLVEYTSFSEALLEDKVYDDVLKAYLSAHPVMERYEIVEQEFGIIPMTTVYHRRRQGKYLINIGAAGGSTKPSTGYTFQNIQEQTRQIAENLASGKDPLSNMSAGLGRFYLYDAVLLRILKEKNLPAWQLFDRLFDQLPAEQVLRFLDEKTGFWEEFRIRNVMPQLPFIKAAFQEMGPLLGKWLSPTSRAPG